MNELQEILKQLKLIPSSGYGETVLIWAEGKIVAFETLNRQLPKYIN